MLTTVRVGGLLSTDSGMYRCEAVGENRYGFVQTGKVNQPDSDTQKPEVSLKVVQLMKEGGKVKVSCAARDNQSLSKLEVAAGFESVGPSSVARKEVTCNGSTCRAEVVIDNDELKAGSLTVSCRAVDKAGNVASASSSYSVYKSLNVVKGCVVGTCDRLVNDPIFLVDMPGCAKQTTSGALEVAREDTRVLISPEDGIEAVCSHKKGMEYEWVLEGGDTEPPTVSLVVTKATELPGEYFVMGRCKAQDEKKVSKVRLYLDGKKIREWAAYGDSANFPFTAHIKSGGSHTLECEVEDGAGNTARDEWSVTLFRHDNLLYCNGYQESGGSITCNRASISDIVLISDRDGCAVRTSNTNEDLYVEAGTEIQVGLKVYRCEGTSPYSYIWEVENVAPVNVEILQPTEGESYTLSGGTASVQVKWTASGDPEGFEVDCGNGTTDTTTSTSYTCTYSSAGTYTITVTAKRGSIEGEDSVRISVVRRDTQEPTVSLSYNIPEGPIKEMDAQISCSVSDDTGVEDVEIYVNGQLVKECSSSTCEATYTIVEPGEYTVECQATDLAGNTATETKSFTIYQINNYLNNCVDTHCYEVVEKPLLVEANKCYLKFPHRWFNLSQNWSADVIFPQRNLWKIYDCNASAIDGFRMEWKESPHSGALLTIGSPDDGEEFELQDGEANVLVNWTLWENVRGDLDSWEVDCGNGATATVPTDKDYYYCVYTEPGDYQVSVRAKLLANGQEYYVSDSVEIHVGQANATIVSFTSNKNPVKVGENVSITCQASTSTNILIYQEGSQVPIKKCFDSDTCAYEFKPPSPGNVDFTCVLKDYDETVLDSSTYTLTVTGWTNEVPEISVSSPENGQVVFVNTPVSVEWAAYDPDGGSVTVTVDCGNGEVKSGLSSSGSVVCEYDGPGDYTITLTAVDDEGSSFTVQRTITATEGESGGEEEDPDTSQGLCESSGYVWYGDHCCGDDAGEATGEAECAPEEQFDPTTCSCEMGKVPPQVTKFDVEVISEEGVSVEWRAYDPDGGFVTVAVDCGNGDVKSGLPGSGSVECAYDGPGDYTITLTAVDDEGSNSTVQRTVGVGYFPPQVTKFDLSKTGENTVLVEWAAYDPDGGFVTVAVYCGNDVVKGGLNSSGSVECVYEEPGDYTITLKVTDDELSIRSYSREISVGSVGTERRVTALTGCEELWESDYSVACDGLEEITVQDESGCPYKMDSESVVHYAGEGAVFLYEPPTGEARPVKCVDGNWVTNDPDEDSSLCKRLGYQWMGDHCCGDDPDDYYTTLVPTECVEILQAYGSPLDYNITENKPIITEKFCGSGPTTLPSSYMICYNLEVERLCKGTTPDKFLKKHQGEYRYFIYPYVDDDGTVHVHTLKLEYNSEEGTLETVLYTTPDCGVTPEPITIDGFGVRPSQELFQEILFRPEAGKYMAPTVSWEVQEASVGQSVSIDINLPTLAGCTAFYKDLRFCKPILDWNTYSPPNQLYAPIFPPYPLKLKVTVMKMGWGGCFLGVCWSVGDKEVASYYLPMDQNRSITFVPTEEGDYYLKVEIKTLTFHYTWEDKSYRLKVEEG